MPPETRQALVDAVTETLAGDRMAAIRALSAIERAGFRITATAAAPPPENSHPIHRVAVVAYLDMPGDDWADAAADAPTALLRWLLLHVGHDVPVSSYRGRPTGTARIVRVDSLAHALRSGDLELTPRLSATPTRVREAHAELVGPETDSRDGEESAGNAG